MIRAIKIGLLLSTLSLVACANFNTIERRTTVPGGLVTVDTKDPERKSYQSGKAIHLDIQQRLVIFDELGNYCAEPSPDGLAAFAAAMGISASDPTSSAASATGSGGSSAASIGLRTQSITLMRDTMYRICEASANGKIDTTTVTTLLRRSQDITAAVLAIEQLTGPVAAQQAALYQTTDASASASLVAVGEQLQLAMKQLENATERLEEATVRKATLDAEKGQVDTRIGVLTSQINNTGEGAPSDAEKIELKAELKVKEARQETLNQQIAALTETIKLRQASVDSAQSTHDLIAQKQETAFASASSGTSGSGTLSAPTTTSTISDADSAKVPEAVKEIVLALLDQDYMTESCVSLLGLSKTTADTTKLEAQCIALVSAEVEARSAETKLRVEQALLEAQQKQYEAKLIEGKTFKLLPKATLDAVMTCITDNGNPKSAKIDLLITKASPHITPQHIALIRKKKTVSELRTLFTDRPNIFNPLATVAAFDGVCQ